MSNRAPPQAAASLAIEDGVLRVSVADPRAKRGSVVEAFVGDHLVGATALRAGKPGLLGSIDLIDFPVVEFPAQLRLMHAGRELSPQMRFDDPDAVLRAAGPPNLTATLQGASGDTASFAVTVDRVRRYGRRLALLVDGAVAGAAMSAPDADGAHRAAFAVSLRAGQSLVVRDVASGAASEPIELQAHELPIAGMAQIARLEARLDAAEREATSLRRQLDATVALSRERMLLDRLDLFYLMLNERIDREVRVLGGPPPARGRPAPPVITFRPSEVEGVGMFDLETNEASEWRWFGPEVTLVLRDVGAPLSRVVLRFYTFGQIEGEQSVRVSLEGVTVGAELRQLPDGPWLLDIPLRRAAGWPDDTVIVHLAFARHHTSAADPRLLSAVFSGAELFTIPAQM